MTTQPYKTTISNLADLHKYIGKELGLSDWVTIPARAAKESPFGTTVAHGFMILSYASKFSYETMEIGDVGMGLNYGLDKLRFTSPTPVGSRVRGRISLLEVEEKPPGVKYKISIVFECEGHDKPVCVAEWLAMAYAA